MRRKAHIIRLDEADSTNTYLRQHTAGHDESMLVAVADYQTAGRGQGTNRWESERGRNLLFSLLVRPKGIAARNQFVLSMAGALAVRDALSTYADGMSVKWPNDIYHADRKISGTLIETTLAAGSVRDCIFGIGINVNQRAFVSDAPNPVSLCQIVGHEVSREDVMEQVLQGFDQYLSEVERGEAAAVVSRYNSHLYRHDGLHAYEDAHGRFSASILRVEPTGHLVLSDTAGRERRYAFKEVKYII